MGAFLWRRAGQSLVTLFLASVVVFFGIRALPGDPALALAGEERDPVALAEVRAQYGLDQPVPVQYWRWLTEVAHGNLGVSLRTGISVTETIWTRIPVTLELALLSLLVAIVLGVGTGVLAAVRHGSGVEWFTNMSALLGLSVPSFWLGIMLILVFAIILGWLPASGYVSPLEDPVGNLQRMVLPALVLGGQFAAILMRQTRSAMLESLGADYVRTARAKGLSERQVVFGHALRNSWITVLTLLGLRLGLLISGAVITEQVFVIPGFGRLVVEAVFTRDYPIIQGVALVSATAYILANLGVDLMYSVANPRIRLAGAAT
ncbi:MAG TPA: ABC transporter permease [Actinomycetota bacterium]|nr:ABC transporter permease [Actinomycetota bacterium]